MGPGLSTYGVRGDALRCLVETSSTVLFPACTVESRGGLYSRVVSGRYSPCPTWKGDCGRPEEACPLGSPEPQVIWKSPVFPHYSRMAFARFCR
jgi:hypothetical protein